MMADGSGMTITPEGADACIDLDTAISRLEAGPPDAGLSVDLGSGQVARLEDTRDAPGFLSRLKAHRHILALAASKEPGARPDAPALMVDSHAKALLDAVKKAR